MSNTTVLLREDIDTIGGRGEVVRVRAGYARNYLLPRGIATLATKGNVKQIEQERAALLKKAAVEKATAEAQLEQMTSIALEFERKAGEHGTLFGSVTSMDIADALNAKGYEIDRRKIVLRDPIKETGEYTVNVKLHREVTLAVPITVTAEGGEVVEAKPEKKSRKKSGSEEAKPEAGGEETAAVAEETTPIVEGSEPDATVAEETAQPEAETPTEGEAAT